MAKLDVKGAVKATTTAALYSSAVWSAAMIAGGIMLMAVTTGGAGLLALGGVAALVGTLRTYSRLDAVDAVNSAIDTAVDDIENGKKPAVKLSGLSKLLGNPVVKLVTSATLLAAGIALVAATGAVLPLALGAAMIASGGAGTVTGGVGSLYRGIKQVKKLFHRKEKKPLITQGPLTHNKPTPHRGSPKTVIVIPAKTDFTAAANGNTAEQTTTAATKPVAAAPQPPKAG